MRNWVLTLRVNEDGEPVQATVTVLENEEAVRITTQACEPFLVWQEAMASLLASLPAQQRLW